MVILIKEYVFSKKLAFSLKILLIGKLKGFFPEFSILIIMVIVIACRITVDCMILPEFRENSVKNNLIQLIISNFSAFHFGPNLIYYIDYYFFFGSRFQSNHAL